jgi:hypothetical protein
MKAQAQIEKLRTLQESFDNLASSLEKLSNSSSAIALDKEVADGKQSLVDAIEYKGGESSADKSLQGIAEDIKEIPNFDQWARLAGMLAGNSYKKDTLQGHEENVKSGSITKLTDPFGVITTINNYAFTYWDLLEEIDLPFLIKLENNMGLYAFDGCNNLKKINFPRLEFIGNSSSSGYFISSPFITEIYLPELKQIGSGYPFSSFVEHLICPKLQIISNYPLFRGITNIKNIVFGTLTMFVDSGINANCINLRNITIGQGTDINLPFQHWTATNVIAEGQSGIDELNNNLRTNLLEKLADHSTDGQTRTLRLGWLAKVSQENIDYANSKGWTLTT